MTRNELAKTILAIAAAGAVVAAAATLPGLAYAIGPFLKKKDLGVRRDSLERALKKLRERRLVELKMNNGAWALSVTEQGKNYLRKLDFESLTLPRPRRWDGTWSVILFDIPEKHKRARDALRQKLRQLGCFQFHKSVFVHPLPCEDEIDFIAEMFQIRQFVTVFRTSSLGHQEHRARRYFQLV